MLTKPVLFDALVVAANFVASAVVSVAVVVVFVLVPGEVSWVLYVVIALVTVLV